MASVLFAPELDDAARRARLFAGDLVVLSPLASSLALIHFARELIAEAFGRLDPERAQFELPVEEYVAILARLKPKFINHPRSSQLVRETIAEAGAALDRTYFDVPRLRSATSDAYLTSGLAYAFHPHRDTWYAAPMSQLNWWIPVFPICADNTIAFHTRHWAEPIANESGELDYQEYVDTSRKEAAKHVLKDTRKQPHATQPVDPEPEIRLVVPVGGVLLFSGAQLHSTVPNTSGRTRFSVDFRTANHDDLAASRGARNVDSECRGSALPDFFRASDLAKPPPSLVRADEDARAQRTSRPEGAA